jgi:hypothetical protein
MLWAERVAKVPFLAAMMKAIARSYHDRGLGAAAPLPPGSPPTIEPDDQADSAERRDG